jgi:DNA polymerase V
MDLTVSQIIPHDLTAAPAFVPYYDAPRPAAGFPSPAAGYEQEEIDLNQVLLKNPEATFYCRADGNCLAPYIESGDLLVVDKRAKIRSGDLILFPIGQEILVKKIIQHPDGSIELVSLTGENSPVHLPEDDPFVPIGKVTAIIKQLP